MEEGDASPVLVTDIDFSARNIDRMPSSGTVTVDVPTLQLLQGDYTVDIAVHAQDGDITHDYVREAVRFYVKNPRGDSGVFRPQVHWSFKSPEEKESR